jgi:N6-adenosine-specific RNA methylase IME4
MATELIRYESACKALAAAINVDEVAKIRDQARAIKAAAKIAGNRDLEANAWELRKRAERRLNDMMEAQRNTVGLAKAGRKPKIGVSDTPITLAEAGIDKNLAKQARNAGAVSARQFEKIIEEGRDRILHTNPRSKEWLKHRRQQKERHIAARTATLSDQLGSKLYNVIYADPPWRYENPNGRGDPEFHYSTMALEEIKQISIPAVASAVLFLWTPTSHLVQALEVMQAWGFTYKSQCIWHKTVPTNFGIWFHMRHEILLIGTRGDIPPPAQAMQWKSVIKAPRGQKHSRKPNIFRQLIEAYFPNAAKLELFGRERMPGWDVCGNEAPTILEAAE